MSEAVRFIHAVSPALRDRESEPGISEMSPWSTLAVTRPHMGVPSGAVPDTFTVARPRV